MQGTIQKYTLDMADGTALKPLIVKQGDTNSRFARISLVAFKEPWTIPFGCQIHINVHKNDGTYANATCTQEDEHTVLAPITEQMTAVPGTQLGELFFLGVDGDIRSQTFPLVVWDAVSDLDRMVSSDDFQALKEALRDVKASTEVADIAAQYATEQGNSARDGAQRANDAADSIQVAVDAAAAAKACESNAKDSETAAAQAQQEVTDYVEAQKAAFVGYSKRESDSKYANALTKTAMGEGGITVEDAWTAPVLGLDVAGKSEQVATTGAQLQPFGYDTITHVGVTLTIKNDLVSLLGTATYSGGRNTLKLPDVTLQAGSYTISVSDAINAVMAVTDDANSVLVQGAGIEELKFNIVKETSIHIGFNVISGNVYNITGLRIMLNAGDTALPWEPYTGGAPSPSPDYPQDIISTGTVSTGAQMLNVDTIAQGMISTETGAESESSVFVRSDYIPVKPGDYILSGDGLKPYFNHVMYFSKEKVILSSLSIKPTNGKFTVADETAYIRIRFISKDGTSGTVTPSEVAALKPMLNTGDTALPWEPYTGGKPSPSVEYPQVVEVNVTGTNLIDYFNAKPNETGTIRYDGNRLYYSRDNHGSTSVQGGATWIAYLPAGRIYINSNRWIPLRIYRGNVFDDSYEECNRIYNATGTASHVIDITKSGVYTIGVWSDEVNTEYYIDDLYVGYQANGIKGSYNPPQVAKITLTEPLRGVGEYRDRIMCRDGVWGIDRWITKLILNGSEDWVIYGNSSYISFYTQSVCLPVSMNKREGLCKQLRVMTIGGKNLNTIWLGANNKVVYTIDNQFYNDTLEDKGLANWKAYLAESPLEIITYLDAPTWEPFPDATQQALNELTTYAGTTHLTITAGGPAAEVTLDYVQDTHKAFEQCQGAAKEYTDNQIAAIVAALPTATQAAIVDNQTTRLLQEV